MIKKILDKKILTFCYGICWKCGMMYGRWGMGMKFYRYLYVGDGVKNPGKVKWKLKRHAGVQVYVIVLAPSPDQLEIFHSAYLKQRYYRYHPPIVVGIAASHEEAVEIVVKIAQECVETLGNCNLKEYLKLKANKRCQASRGSLL